MRKKFICFFSVLIFVLSTSLIGCNDSSGLQTLKSRNIKKVAVISVKTDIRLHTKNKGNFVSAISNMAQDMPNGSFDGIGARNLNAEEKFFILKIMEDLQTPFNRLLDSYQISRVSIEDLIQNQGYKNIPVTYDADRYYYSVPSFRNIEQPRAYAIAKLCKDMDVDAVLTYKTYFEREAYRDVFQLPLTPDYLKFFAKLDIIVFGRDGQTMFQKRYEGVSPEIIGYDKSTYQFSFQHEDMERVINKTIDVLKNNIDREINNLIGNT